MTKNFTFLILLLLSVAVSAQEIVNVTDATLQGGQTYTWTADKVYELDGLVYLEAGGVLNIEAGTVVTARDRTTVTTGDNTSALIITRNAQIFARGSADAPIIFTSSIDDLEDAGDLTAADRGLWGGLIILGNAEIATTGNEDGIEGIDADEERAKFGNGTNPAMNEESSGVLNYVSIRHGGAVLSSNNEINGLTLGGVGSGTEIDYIEVFANEDDGIELFGGTVNLKHASVAFCGDDGYDYDYGWRGKGQFWFFLQGPQYDSGRAGEHDGASPDNFPPFSKPVIYNATYIGIGADASGVGGDITKGFPTALLFRDNAGGEYRNSIFTGFNGQAIAIENLPADKGEDSYARLLAGDLVIKDNIFDGFGAGTDPLNLFTAFNTGDTIVADGTAQIADSLNTYNVIGASGIAGIGLLRDTDGMIDPRLNPTSIALNSATPSDDEFFSIVSYKGAFGNRANWLDGWSALSEYGYFGDLVTPLDNTDCIVINDGDLVGGETYNWGGGNCYTLDGLVYLEADATLNIEAGTVIRAFDENSVSTGDNTSALIITRDATINAIGTAAAPIIFTSVIDDLDDNEDLTFEDKGLWGGLIILGNADIATTGREDGIEGIDADEERARFGGLDNPQNEESSGTLKYVSIRHGGAVLSSNNEINGLTLGGVGSGTVIDYVEVFANSDDGIELFGGTVSINHAAVSFCGDDAFDYDFGWRGTGQYWFSLQGDGDDTGRAGEHDGASPDGFAPFSKPTIYNATFIGIGENGAAIGSGDATKGLPLAVIFRDNAGGTYANSIFFDFNGAAIGIEDLTGTEEDSYGRLKAGDLQLNNNYFFGFGRNAGTAADIFLGIDVNENVLPVTTADIVARLTAAGNLVVDPLLNSDLRDDGGEMLDVRPNQFGPAARGAVAAGVAGIEAATYFGAFAPGNGSNNPAWITGWTALDAASSFGQVTGLGEVEASGFLLDAPVPNPATGVTRINFELPRSAEVTITVIDLLGRPLAQRTNQYAAGSQGENLDVSKLPTGTYFVILNSEGNRLLQKLSVKR